MDIQIKFKIKYQHIIKIIYFLLIATLIFGSYMLFVFLYKNVYVATTQTSAITMLKSETNVEIIDAAAFSKVLDHITKKQEEPPLELLQNDKNIFSFKNKPKTKKTVEEKNPTPEEQTNETTVTP